MVCWPDPLGVWWCAGLTHWGSGGADVRGWGGRGWVYLVAACQLLLEQLCVSISLKFCSKLCFASCQNKVYDNWFVPPRSTC